MSTPEPCRIVVTGIGLCTPFGPDRESSWREIVAGQSRTRWLTAPHWPDDSWMAGAPFRQLDHRPYRHREPLVELALSTAAEALEHSRLDAAALEELNVGVVFGTSKGGLHTFSRLFEHQRSATIDSSRSGCDASDATEWLDLFPNQPAVAISRLIGGYGPVLCPIAACATGLAACLRGAELIQSGGCDIVLAGSSDASLQPALLGSFRRLGVVSRESDDPAKACRPFDRHRSGFVVGEGAACLVLERLDSALKRGAKIEAEWLGGRMLTDPFGLTQLDPEGQSLKRLLSDLRTLESPTPDYINLHGTGTLANDSVECQAVRTVFGSSADDFTCSSLKGGMGHLLGAAGSVELAATVLAIRDQVAPPTVNLAEIDADCQLNHVAGIARPQKIERAWKLSLGFGGHLAGACLARFGG